jgi:hypothetical protein
MLEKLLDFIHRTNLKQKGIEEGPWAHEYTDPVLRQQIQQEYDLRYRRPAIPTPYTNPELFDPLTPPEGWYYDPYYECWVQL